MQEITLKIDGMHCSMCEAHLNEVIRKLVNVKKIKSNHSTGICTFTTDNFNLSDEDFSKKVFDESGYRVLSITKNEVAKKGLFSFFKK